jgi:hypothetical protein
MTIFDLKALLTRVGFADSVVGFHEDGEDGLRIVHDGQCWNVFYSERGGRWDEKRYVEESKACLDVLTRLLTDSVVLRELAKHAKEAK